MPAQRGLEETCCQARNNQLGGDWRQFGNNPRDYPDWALIAAILWNLENDPQFAESPELDEVRRLYDAGDIDAASDRLMPTDTIEASS